MLTIFNKETGARLRAGLAVALAVATFLVAVLQGALDAAHFLPAWKEVGAIAMWVQGAVSFLGRFIELGNKIAE